MPDPFDACNLDDKQYAQHMPQLSESCHGALLLQTPSLQWPTPSSMRMLLKDSQGEKAAAYFIRLLENLYSLGSCFPRLHSRSALRFEKPTLYGICRPLHVGVPNRDAGQ